MKPAMVVGIALIIIGIVALAYGGFSFTTSEKVAEIGPLKVEKEKTRSVALPPILGGAAVVAGIALVAVGTKRA